MVKARFSRTSTGPIAWWKPVVGAAWAVLALGVCRSAASASSASPDVLASRAAAMRPSAMTTNAAPPWFPVGEQLRYRICWGVIPVGEIQSSLSWVEVPGRPLLAITYRARSNRVLRQLYPVEDDMVTTLDPATFLPVTFRMDMRQGSHFRHELTTFDYVAGKAVWKPLDRQKTREFVIDPETHDLLSLMYYVRKDGFHSHSNRTLRALADGKVRDMPVAVDGHEMVPVPGRGAVDCLRLVPTFNFEGFFVNSGGVTIWISDDARGICTRGRVSLPVGTISAELVEWSSPGAAHGPASGSSP